MQNSTLVSAIISIIAIMITISIHLNNSINKKIEEKLNDHIFIKRLASEIRLPFIIFDENERYLVNTDYNRIIEKIEIKK